jgi:hypothetical protein
VTLLGLVMSPMALVTLVGPPAVDAGDIVVGGRLTDDGLVSIGTSVFLVLWAWFVTIALHEAWLVVRRRFDVDHDESPASVGATSTRPGAVRRLVRTALSSGSAMVIAASALGAAPTGVSAASSPAPAVSATEPADGESHGRDAADVIERVVRSSGRDTPFSVAAKIGRPEMRDAIAVANRGRRAPDGATWHGGVFPAGMEVVIPDEVTPRVVVHWQRHLVEEGDSVYGIAAGLVAEDAELGVAPRLVRDVADEILRRNLGRTMDDGFVFHEPSLIRIGWVLDVPAHVAVEPIVADVVHAPRTSPTPTPRSVVPVVVPEHDPLDPVARPASLPVSAPPAITDVSERPAGDEVQARDGVVVDGSEQDERGGLGAAVLLGAGAIALVETRRRTQLRRARAGSHVVAPTPTQIRTERSLRRLGAVDRAVRIDLVTRLVGHRLVGSPAAIAGLLVGDDGAIDVLFVAEMPSATASPFVVGPDLGSWRLPADVPFEALVDEARLAGQPCPALVHVGRAEHEGRRIDVLIDVEAIGVLVVDGPATETGEILHTLAASLSMAAVGEPPRLVVHDLDPALLPSDLASEFATSLDDALDRAATMLGALPGLLGRRRVVDLRVRGVGGERWEPVVLVHRHAAGEFDSAASAGTGSASREELDDLVGMARGGGRGFGVVTDAPLLVDHGVGATLRRCGDRWHLDRFDLSVEPVGLRRRELLDVVELVRAAETSVHAGRAMTRRGDVVDDPVGEVVELRGRSEAGGWAVPEHTAVVHLFGPPRVTTRQGAVVEFDRGRSVELLAWLVTHREHPTRGAARSAMWDVAVRDATFSNVVSDARRSLARAIGDAPEVDWIERTLTDRLPLRAGIVSDAELVRSALVAARHRSHAAAVRILQGAVPYVSGAPLLGTDYLWPHAEGIASDLVLTAIEFTVTLARHHLALSDIAGVFEATAVGLEVLPGHEELVAVRMQAHAQSGDLAGVRSEWIAYERGLAADGFGDAEPAPKLVQLRRHLLAG